MIEVEEHYYEIKNMSDELMEVTPEKIYNELEKRYSDCYGYGYFCAWGCISEDNTLILIQRDSSEKIRFMMYNEKGEDDLYEKVLSDKNEFLNLLENTMFKESNSTYEHYQIILEIDITNSFDELYDLLPYMRENDIPWERVYEN